MQWVPAPKTCLMTSIYLELRPTPCAALSGLSAIWTLNPGLTPWAVLLDPFGVLGFAPETSYRETEPRFSRCFRVSVGNREVVYLARKTGHELGIWGSQSFFLS